MQNFIGLSQLTLVGSNNNNCCLGKGFLKGNSKWLAANMCFERCRRCLESSEFCFLRCGALSQRADISKRTAESYNLSIFSFLRYALAIPFVLLAVNVDWLNRALKADRHGCAANMVLQLVLHENLVAWAAFYPAHWAVAGMRPHLLVT